MYIRTKDGISDETKVNLIENALNGEIFVESMIDGYIYHLEKVIKQADTIEELCDMFILDNEKFGKEFYYNHNGRLNHYRDSYYSFRLKDIKENKIDLGNCNFYGAIWTDRGLIYAVKLNDNEEFELL